MNDLLEAALKVLEYTKMEIEVYIVTKEARLRIELQMPNVTYVEIVPEGDDTRPTFLTALADLSAAVDAQIEADVRDMEARRPKMKTFSSEQLDALQQDTISWIDVLYAADEDSPDMDLVRVLRDTVNLAQWAGDLAQSRENFIQLLDGKLDEFHGFIDTLWKIIGYQYEWDYPARAMRHIVDDVKRLKAARDERDTKPIRIENEMAYLCADMSLDEMLED